LIHTLDLQRDPTFKSLLGKIGSVTKLDGLGLIE